MKIKFKVKSHFHISEGGGPPPSGPLLEGFLQLFADREPIEDRSSSRSIRRCARYPPLQGILAVGARNEIGRDPLRPMLYYIIEVDIFNS